MTKPAAFRLEPDFGNCGVDFPLAAGLWHFRLYKFANVINFVSAVRSCYSWFELLQCVRVLVNFACSRDRAIVMRLGVAIVFAIAMQFRVANSLRCCPVSSGLPV